MDSQEEDITEGRRSVHDIRKMFGGQDSVSSSSPSYSTSYKKSTYSSPSPDSPTSSRTTTTVSRGGISETTTTTTTRSSETFMERVKRGSQTTAYPASSRTSRVTSSTVTSDNDAKDLLYGSLLSSPIRNGSPTDSKTTVSTIETVRVNTDTTDAEDKLFNTLISTSPKDSSPTASSNDIKTTITTRTSSMAEDDLYDTLLPKSITSVSSVPSVSSSSSSSIRREITTVDSSRGGDSPTSSIRRTSSYSSYTDDSPTTRTTSYTISSTPSEDYNTDRSVITQRTDSYEYSSLNNPSVYSSRTYRSSSRSDDTLGDQTYSTSVKNVYAAPERTVLEKDLCTYCRKPFTGDAKMVLDDMKINCHASCFKCEVCNSSLGHMKAGDSMWIYKRMVHCENCFEVTKEKWRR